jgi:heme exporter protein D
MSDHATYVAAAYAIAFLTIGGMATRILLDYRRLKAELARLGGRDEDGRDQDGGRA